MIKINQLSIDIGKKHIINNVSTEIKKGAITAIIGPNGAGKSTLLNAATRLIDVTKGTVELNGTEITKLKSDQVARQLAVLKQSNHTNLKLSVRDLVNFGRFPYSKGRLTQEDIGIIDESLDYMGLTSLQDTYLDELSGGQRQRAFIAMTLAQDTDYIFLDEPLNNLDMKHSVQMMQLLRRLVREKQKTIVIVIHDINFASCYADYIVAMKDGEILLDGPKDSVITPEALKKVYDMDINIECIFGQQICVYFDDEKTVDDFVREAQLI
ncbi:ATP-binding cassette domain-containing protein [Macrococcus hajekii]|uniref:ATP-binding cassette domain-containing protein n=1 Tax=Macrococcus hajekii TaxID=198482 RepID=A0A4R6BI97_9STAP|nr:ATP-binding cassette domain-containing protein [Macrococcus hajekii]TDM01196.1 ATP-binding cassette domain-containing protein [Macrococcus hajekii]GGB11767.1 ABC transporter permease [Macrococcus hajekii]